MAILTFYPPTIVIPMSFSCYGHLLLSGKGSYRLGYSNIEYYGFCLTVNWHPPIWMLSRFGSSFKISKMWVWFISVHKYESALWAILFQWRGLLVKAETGWWGWLRHGEAERLEKPMGPIHLWNCFGNVSFPGSVYLFFCTWFFWNALDLSLPVFCVLSFSKVCPNLKFSPYMWGKGFGATLVQNVSWIMLSSAVETDFIKDKDVLYLRLGIKRCICSESRMTTKPAPGCVAVKYSMIPCRILCLICNVVLFEVSISLYWGKWMEWCHWF